MKRSILAACIATAATLILTGCANVNKSSSGFDLSKLDPHIQLNKTTLRKVRKMLGTPTCAAKTSNGDTVVGYALVGHNTAAVFARNLGTMGFKAHKYEYTLKNPMFRIRDGVVVEYKKDGVAFLYRRYFTEWNECELKLTPEEINSPANFSDIDVCDRYADYYAAKENILPAEVDIEKEFEKCDVSCQVKRQMREAFPDIQDFDSFVAVDPKDGKLLEKIFH